MNDFEEPGGFRPHRQVNHGSDSLKKANIAKLAHAAADRFGTQQRVSITYEDHDDRVVLRIPQKLTVDFFTRKNRWRVRGQKKTTHGTVEQFIAFVRSQCGGLP